MEREFSYGLMDASMRVNIRMIRRMGSELSTGLTGEFIKVSGKAESNTGKASTIARKDR